MQFMHCMDINQELQDLPRLGGNLKVPTMHPGRSLFMLAVLVMGW